MTYLINLVLAVLCTLLLSGINLGSLHTFLHQDLLDQGGQSDACSFAGGPFMGVIESTGGHILGRGPSEHLQVIKNIWREVQGTPEGPLLTI